MKTHMNNTQAQLLANDITAHAQFLKHQQFLHSAVKPIVVTKRKSEVTINRNNKKQINFNPQTIVNHLFNQLQTKPYKSNIDNQARTYQQDKLILADKLAKNKQQKHIKNQHQRQLKSMQHRIDNCKSYQQRKKDNTDPIVNPTYFIKSANQLNANSLTIENYSKQVLAKNRPKSGVVRKVQNYQNSSGQQNFIEHTNQQQRELVTNQRFGSVPNYSKVRPQSAKVEKKQDDLPACGFKAILNHIVENKIFKETDIKVLYVRLCHRYGEQQVDAVWESLMAELEK